MTHTFIDNNQQNWELSLNGYTLEKVRDDAGVLLTEIADNEFALLIKLHTDHILLVKVLWAMVEDEADERGISPVAFAKAMGGDALANAADALVRAINDFFTNPAAREALTKLMEMTKEVQGRMQTMMQKELAEQIAAANLDRLAQSFIDSFTNSLESQGRTTAATPSAN